MPRLRRAFFSSGIATSPKWKMEAARPASTLGSVSNRVMKSSIFPAPPEAITGTLTALETASSISRSKPPFTPSVSMELRTISPAPSSTPFLIQLMASRPVSSRPPLANTRNWPSSRFTSAERTTHWSPYFREASRMSSGFRMAPELTLTLSAPHFSTRSKSSTVLMPPPTVRGIKTVLAVSQSTSVKSLRPSAEAVMS